MVAFAGVGQALAAPTADELLAAERLRTFCAACHGLGNLRFIPDQNDSHTWTYILTERSPRSGKVWAEAIAETLSWPSDTPPSSGDMLLPPERDWMPKGGKRWELAADRVNAEPTRRFILRALGK